MRFDRKFQVMALMDGQGEIEIGRAAHILQTVTVDRAAFAAAIVSVIPVIDVVGLVVGEADERQAGPFGRRRDSTSMLKPPCGCELGDMSLKYLAR